MNTHDASCSPAPVLAPRPAPCPGVILLQDGLGCAELIDVRSLTPSDVRRAVRCIIHHLAGINRYAGGTRITVAQHLVEGAQAIWAQVMDASGAAGLELPECGGRGRLAAQYFALHDWPEATTGGLDVPYPLMLLPEFSGLRDLQERHLPIVHEAFGLVPVPPQWVSAAVAHADFADARRERRWCMAPHEVWGDLSSVDGPPKDVWSSEDAERKLQQLIAGLFDDAAVLR